MMEDHFLLEELIGRIQALETEVGQLGERVRKLEALTAAPEPLLLFPQLEQDELREFLAEVLHLGLSGLAARRYDVTVNAIDRGSKGDPRFLARKSIRQLGQDWSPVIRALKAAGASPNEISAFFQSVDRHDRASLTVALRRYLAGRP